MRESDNGNSKYGWRWLDGTEYSWSNWYHDEPEAIYRVAHMYVTGTWWSDSIVDVYRYICKQKEIPSIYQ